MSTLRFNPHTGEFVVMTGDKDRAVDTGLTLSTTARGPNGEPVYFSKDPYAALNFYADADQAVRSKLSPLWDDYESSWAIDCLNTYPMGGGIQLRPYQNAGVEYCLKRRHALIGDAPGVGKTFTGIGLANAMGAERTLVVCPGRIRKQWQGDIRTGSIIPKVRVVPVMRSADGIATWPHYTVISYDLLRNPAIHEALCEIDWDLMLLDEAHMLKEVNARRTQAIFGGGRRIEFKDALSEHAKRIVAMTGTPLPNRPRECYTLARSLCHESIDYMTPDEFRYRFNPSGRMENGHIREEIGRLPELQARLRCNFMIRRLKENVLRDLPDKSYEFAYIEEDGRISDIIRRERMLSFQVDDLKKPWFDIDGEIATLRREMGEAKVPQAIAHVKYLLDIVEIPKIVLFSHHRSVMDMLKAGLEHYGVVELRGGTSDRQLQNNKHKFINDPDTRVWSGQLDASGVGLDGLQAVCSHCVIIEPSWAGGPNEQAIDRIHRSGQHANVVAQFLVAEGSLDEKILATVIGKTHTTYEALDNKKTRMI